MKMRLHASWRDRSAQNGFVLVTTLMFLVALTVLGLSIMSTNTLEEKMAGYFRDRQLAMEAAEAGLREAERDLLFGSRAIIGEMGFEDNCSTDGLCYPKKTGSPIWADLEAADNAGWMRGEDAAKTVKYGTYSSPPATALAHVAAQPRYFFEVLRLKEAAGASGGGSGIRYVYRVSAVGFGRRVSTRVVLQSTIYP